MKHGDFIDCPDCCGSGNIITPHISHTNKLLFDSDKCPTCQGIGKTGHETIKIDVPDGWMVKEFNGIMGMKARLTLKSKFGEMKHNFYVKLPNTQGKEYTFTCEVCGGLGFNMIYDSYLSGWAACHYCVCTLKGSPTIKATPTITAVNNNLNIQWRKVKNERQ